LQSKHSTWAYWADPCSISCYSISNLTVTRGDMNTAVICYRFYFWDLHPDAFVTKTLLWWSSIATKFFYVFSFISLTSLHVSARAIFRWT
jgi:hypothetical protein